MKLLEKIKAWSGRKSENAVTKEDIAFLRAAADVLPGKYAFLKQQTARPEQWKEKISAGDANFHMLLVEIVPDQDFRQKNWPHLCKLDNIQTANRKSGRQESIELYLQRGLLSHYRTSVKISELDFSTLDGTKVQEHVIAENEPETEGRVQLEQIFAGAPSKLLAQLEFDGSCIETEEEGDLFPIKNYEDGNFLAVHENGSLFLLIHDPYTMKKLFDSKEAFFSAVASGTFDIDNAEPFLVQNIAK